VRRFGRSADTPSSAFSALRRVSFFAELIAVRVVAARARPRLHEACSSSTRDPCPASRPWRRRIADRSDSTGRRVKPAPAQLHPSLSALLMIRNDVRNSAFLRQEYHLPRRTLVNWDQIKGNWKQFKGKARQQWGKLTDDELDQVEGRREELVGRIQEKYGIARDEAERQVRDWEGTL
jgi:uncharacterized protein YjbJ (UPF0337 family)